jgi:hypothetical protein
MLLTESTFSQVGFDGHFSAGHQRVDRAVIGNSVQQGALSIAKGPARRQLDLNGISVIAHCQKPRRIGSLSQ